MIIFLQQLFRMRKKSLYVGLIAVTTMFFCMSLNLYCNSVENLGKVNETYSTVALMELYGDIDSDGNLVADLGGDYVGYMQALVHDYDLTPIIASPYVKKYDLRSRYAAYVPGHAVYMVDGERISLRNAVNTDIVRFVIKGAEPLVVKIGSGKIEYSDYRQVEILESAAGIFDYPDELCFWLSLKEQYRESYYNDIRVLNNSEEVETVMLYPEVEYIASVIPGIAERDASTGRFKATGKMRIFYDSYGNDYRIHYTTTGEETRLGAATGQPFWIHRWEDVQKESKLNDYYSKAINAQKYTSQTLPVTLTDDISGVAAFHLGAAYLVEGRMITPEEYKEGSEVCLISARLAQNQGWRVGDTIYMEFYDGSPFPNVYSDAYMTPTYNKNTVGVFDSGTYIIVGIYDQRELTGNSGISEETLAQPWNNLYIPKKSVNNRPDEGNEPIHGVLLSIWLQNESVDAFLNEMEVLGITKEKAGGYEARFTIYDQGYSQVQPSLTSMLGTARLLLILSATVLIVTLLLTAYFFAQSQKQSVGIFRMLGGSKRQAMGSILLCALLIVMVGAVLGMTIGYGISEGVCNLLLHQGLKKNQLDTAYQVFAVMAETTLSVSYETDVHLELVVLSGCVTLLLFLVLVTGFVLMYVRKEPSALLPHSKA